MRAQDREPTRRWAARIALSLLVAVVAWPLMGQEPSVVEARRYGRPNYTAYIERCKARCGRVRGAMVGCASRERRKQVANCKAVFTQDKAACTDAACRRQVRLAKRACVQSAGGSARYLRKGSNGGACSRCCQRSKGQGDCQSYFSGACYGSSRYRSQLNCPEGCGGASSGGSPSPAFVDAAASIRTWTESLVSWFRHLTASLVQAR